MKAVQILEKHKVAVVDIPRPEPKADEVLIRVEASGICGTDVHMYNGQSMGGYPVVPGHEFAGIVEAVGKDVSRIRVGERVAVEPNLSCNNCPECLENRQHLCRNWAALGVTLPGGMAEYAVAPEYVTFSLGDLDTLSGSFVEPLSCVLHGVERLAPKIGDRILLLGYGPIGMLLLRVLRSGGAAWVDTVETDPGRREMAEREGFGAVMPRLEDAAGTVYDAVIDATGVLAVESAALDLVRPGGKVLLFGVPPEGGTFPFEPYKLFRRELTVLSSFTSLRNSLQAIRMMAKGQVVVSDLVSHRLPVEKLEDAFKMIIEKKEPVLKVIMEP